MSGSDLKLELSQPVRLVLARLRQAGHSTFLVGGAVRDAVLHRPIQDWDVATSAPPDLVSSLFSRVIPTGLRHGTVTVRIQGQNIEVSTFRGSSILEDLSHRDFTLDAMAYDPETGSLLDPNRGLEDCQMGLLRAVGDPVERLREDPLRALRAVRLASELHLEIHCELGIALAKVSSAINKVAPERIRVELERLILSEAPSRGLHTLTETGILPLIIPELFSAAQEQDDALPQVLFRTLNLLPARSVLRWAGLLHRLGGSLGELHSCGSPQIAAGMAREVLLRLKMSKRKCDMVSHLILHQKVPIRPAWSEGELRELLVGIGVGHVREVLCLRRASLMAAHADPGSIRSLEELDRRLVSFLEAPGAQESLRPVLDGTDVMELLGLEPGPKVGEILAEIQKAVAADPGLNRRDVLSTWVSHRYRGVKRAPQPAP